MGKPGAAVNTKKKSGCVRRYPAGGLTTFHGPRYLARYTDDGTLLADADGRQAA